MSHFNKYQVTYRAPSNIAFIKYWGKKGRQLPINPSLSMTLSESYTETCLEFTRSDSGFSLESIYVDDIENISFRAKLDTFFNSILDELDFLNSYKLTIKTSNTFPHSTGIASSASGMSAICMGLIHFEAKLKEIPFSLERASFYSRIASGSASRSVYPGFSHWGESHLLNSSNEYAREISFSKIPKLYDAIAIVSASEKTVSSSVGHSLINFHPFKEGRINQANCNFKDIIHALENNQFNQFGEILEQEALSLHALMMSSSPSYILLEPKSLELINRVRAFRDKTKLSLYFTIDAGPNIHLIYPETHKTEIESFIKSELNNIAKDIIFDSQGTGPEFISEKYE